MNKVLLTGATGCVGSALAASFLAQSIPLVVLSRNDPDGERTENAILAAATGFGLDIAQEMIQHLQVVNVDFSDLEHCVPSELVADVTVAWHCAAEMSYSPHKLASSFEANVGNSTRLYRLLAKAAPDLQRFYYVSTAYVAGMHGGTVAEVLHGAVRLINPYQVSKWGAEHALYLEHQANGVPLTLFRPSVVVGHRATGWTARNGFGFYMFADAMRACSVAGHDHLTMAVRPEVRADLVPIDQVVADVLGLTLRAPAAQPAPFEVFHCSGGLNLTTRALLTQIAAASGLRLSFGTPLTTVEQKFARATEINLPFANTEWTFRRERLDRALGRQAAPAPLTAEVVERQLAWYFEADGAPAAATALAAPARALAD
ncbi:MAG: NAD-dependent epimerase/dehydratase family protein [Gammaproteobacteria bacterium]